MDRREFVKAIVAAASTPIEVLAGFAGGLVVTKKIIQPHKIPCFYYHKGWRVRVQHVYRHGWKFVESYWAKEPLFHSFLFHDSETSLTDVMARCEIQMRVLFERPDLWNS